MTTGAYKGRVYLSQMQGDLKPTKVSLPTQLNQSREGIRQLCWEQLQCDVKINFGPGCNDIISRGWETAQWSEKWQHMEDESHICHVIALLDIKEDDDTFYFDKCKHKWTEEDLLKVLINPDWDIPPESIQPLMMLADYWGIDTSFPENDPELAEALELATGASFPLQHQGDFDSPDKPLAKKRGIAGPGELMQEECNTPQACSGDEELLVTKVVIPPVSLILPRTPPAPVPPNNDNAFLPITVVVRLACGTLTESVLIIALKQEPIWRVILIKKKDWSNKKAVKSTLHRELASWLPVMDASLRHPLIKLYHWNLVYSSSVPGMHLVILTLHPQFTKFTRRWKPVYRFYAPQLLHNIDSLDPSWSFIEKLPMASQYAQTDSHHE